MFLPLKSQKNKTVNYIGSLRWFGKNDLITPEEIYSGGAKEVVTALHEKAIGAVWAVSEIQAVLDQIHAAGLDWTVVESLPVHEDIKKGKPERDHWIDNYILSLQNLAACGIRVICYNFMPLLDWVRTDLHHPVGKGRDALAFDWIRLALFDIYILSRSGAGEAYPGSVVEAAEILLASLDEEGRKTLIHTLLKGTQSFVNGPMGELDSRDLVSGFQSLLHTYDGIGTAELRDNYRYFLSRVVPAAADAGIFLAVHPDDPPFSIFGLPRILSTAEDYEWLAKAHPSSHNGITFCTGSLGSRPDNDLAAFAEKFAERIHFLHLRFTKLTDTGFFEDEHLSRPDTLKKILRALENSGHEQLVFRPDHGQRMLHDFDYAYNPGYPLLGRLKGLHELEAFIQAFHL